MSDCAFCVCEWFSLQFIQEGDHTPHHVKGMGQKQLDWPISPT